MADAFVPFIVQQLEKYPGLRASRLFEMVNEHAASRTTTGFGET